MPVMIIIQSNPNKMLYESVAKHIYVALRNPSEKWSKYLFEYDNMDYSRFNENPPPI